VTLTGAGLAVLGTTGPALARAVARLGAGAAATVADPPVAGERSTAHDLPAHRPHAA